MYCTGTYGNLLATEWERERERERYSPPMGLVTAIFPSSVSIANNFERPERLAKARHKQPLRKKLARHIDNLIKSVYDLLIPSCTIDTLHTYIWLKAVAYKNTADDASRRLHNFKCNRPLTVTGRN